MGDTNCNNYLDYSKQEDSTLHEEEWRYFTCAGYTMANNGDFGLLPTYIAGTPLDNIFVKGCIIKKSYNVIKNYMNDYYMLLADIIID